MDSLLHFPLPLALCYRHKIAILLIGLLFLALTPAAEIESRSELRERTSHAVSKTCTSNARFPKLCYKLNMTLQRFSKALSASTATSSNIMDMRLRSAYEDCLELLENSVDALSRSLHHVAARKLSYAQVQDIVILLSAVSTNHETCIEGFQGLNGSIKNRMIKNMSHLSKLVDNYLTIFSATTNGDNSSIIPHNKYWPTQEVKASEYPSWVGTRENGLLEIPADQISADIVVSKDGNNGAVKTIAEAINRVPNYGSRRFVIKVRAGRYEETNLNLGTRKTNVMIVGDGKEITIISGSKSVFDNLTTFNTATFAANGKGFIARDITFENTAGPEKHQAVALRVGADQAVIYRCNIMGYQDTLNVFAYRQFYRECDIYGTVDFIFGDAAVVIQNCTIFARKPLPHQKNAITAQGRDTVNKSTGISIHACRILPTQDLQATNHSIQTYLGRPWRKYSRTVYMQSYIGDHIHPKGWLEWDGSFALDTVYYGEYDNYGPGADLRHRVQWPGYQNMTNLEATQFTVANFIDGLLWLPSTGVPFNPNLTEISNESSNDHTLDKVLFFIVLVITLIFISRSCLIFFNREGHVYYNPGEIELM